MAYVGEYRDRLRDGHGAYLFPGGSFQYEGDWKRGKMHGRGVFSLSDGSSYEGDFVDGEMEGIGLRRWADGSTYNGQFHRGERHGEGVQIGSTGEVYEGHWANNRRHGLGELRLVNGDVYRGDFYHHKPHGTGRMKFAGGGNGNIYDGDWVDGVICGRGVLKNAKGATLYEGEWLHGQRHGHGMGRTVSDDSATSSTVVYDGVWKNDKPMAPTSRLGFKVVVARTSDADAANNIEDEYQDAPPVITLDKKQKLLLPSLAIATLHESPLGNELSIVTGESGRRLRLRVFEGAMPSATPSPADPPADPQSSDIVPPSQWHFVTLSSPTVDSDGSQGVVENGDGASSITGDSTKPEEEEEHRTNEVVIVNAGGVARFGQLALPTLTLVGSYHLVCDCEGNDDGFITPVYLPLQVVE